MKKWLKLLGIIVGLIIVGLLVAAILLITLVNPNRFKPLIMEQIKQRTGREILIRGDLSWSFFPYLGIKVKQVELSNPPMFKQPYFAEIDSATINVKVLPLLNKRVESSGVVIDGLKLRLIKQANGNVNWQFTIPTSRSSRSNDRVTQDTSSPSAAFALFIAGVDIQDATIEWIDEQKKQRIEIDKFNLSVDNVQLDKPFTVKAHGDVSGKNPNFSGNVALSSQIGVDINQHIYTLNNVQVAATLKQKDRHFNTKWHGQIIFDQNHQTLELHDIQAQIANLALTTNAKMTVIDQPHISGKLMIHPFDLKKWLQETGQDNVALQVGKNMSGSVNFSLGTSLSSVDMQGNMHMDTLQVAKVQMSNVTMQPHMQNGVLTLSGVTADFYAGRLLSNVDIYLNGAEPRIAMQGKLIDVQSAALLADLANNTAKLSFSGAANVELSVTTVGSNSDALMSHLNGRGKMYVNKGTLIGIDLPYWINTAYALTQHQSTPTDDAGKTEFNTLAASAVIHNGVVMNDDLQIISAVTDTRGRGEINLVSQQIHYQLQTTVSQAEQKRRNVFNLYGLSVPLLITGDLHNPHIRLEMDLLMKEVGKQQVEKVKTKVQEQIQKKLQDIVPEGQANELLEQGSKVLNGLLGQ
ncbi:MAG: hypothetical protein A3E83_08285 [Gammaproteobacteria bacterium RIFCSPHIGHO2_12_FULL_41_20]|nr:MAG: hypothetical protein A3E83_08285 [Gammaproteobacteria bacterium RIFCSPHIGHO2_12_FULL_41_20]